MSGNLQIVVCPRPDRSYPFIPSHCCWQHAAIFDRCHLYISINNTDEWMRNNIEVVSFSLLQIWMRGREYLLVHVK